MAAPNTGPSACPLEDAPLREAVRHARYAFDITVLVPDFCRDLWHPYELADHYVAIASADLPRHERRLRLVGTEQVAHQVRLTPQQSAAVLRDRHLRFLRRSDVTDRIAVRGLVCHGGARVRAADPAFDDAVAQDMHDSGVPLLGWITRPGGLRPFGAVPSQADLEDTRIVPAYTAVARQILNTRRLARGGRPRSDGWDKKPWLSAVAAEAATALSQGVCFIRGELGPASSARSSPGSHLFTDRVSPDPAILNRGIPGILGRSVGADHVGPDGRAHTIRCVNDHPQHATAPYLVIIGLCVVAAAHQLGSRRARCDGLVAVLGP